MKELTDLTIKDLQSTNTSINTLIINQNFAQVKASILLLQSTFGLQIQNNTIGTPTTKLFVGQVSADKMYLPNIGDPNNTASARITFDGSDGSIKASGLATTNDIFTGNDVFVGETGKGGRVRLYPDRNTDISKPPRLGDFRFIGPHFQGYIIQDDIPSTFSFSILGGSPGQDITVQVNDITLISIGYSAWVSNAITTSLNLVNAILVGGNAYVTASYSSGVITLSSLPGLSSALNGLNIVITGLITTDVTSGTMSGGIDGIEKWINFGEGGSVGPTGPAGPAYGSSGTSGISGVDGLDGQNGPAGPNSLIFRNTASLPVGPGQFNQDGTTTFARFADGLYLSTTPMLGYSGTAGATDSALPWLQGITLKATLQGVNVNDPTQFGIFIVQTIGTSGGQYTFSMTEIISNGGFSVGDDVAISYTKVGTSGTAGSAGSSGYGSSGSSGVDGGIGLRGFTGDPGSSGSAGLDGSAGTSGSSGTSPSLASLTSFDVPLGDASTTGFAWSSGFFTSWNDLYSVGQSLEDLDKVIRLLAPTPAPSLGSLAPMVLDSYYANPISYYPSFAGSSGLAINLGSSGAAINNTLITDSSSTNVFLANMSTAPWTSGGGFAKEPPKTLTAFRDATNLGSINYPDNSINPGLTINGSLEVTEYDYWNGVPGRAGFWPALVAQINNIMSGATYGSHNAELSWESAGTNLTTLFWYDNPVNPGFSSKALTTSATAFTAKWISGVPSLLAADTITATTTISNAVSKFYLSRPLVVASTTEILMSSFGATISGAQAPGSLTGVAASGSVRNNIYNEDIVLNATGYNAKGSSINSNIRISDTFGGRTMRVDTVSDETLRHLSGGIDGDSPSFYGGTFDTTSSLVGATPYQYELQMLDGYYQRLSGISYANNYPATGPDYTTDPNTDYRWVLFEFGPMNGISGAIITLNGILGTWSMDPITYITSGLKIQAKVDDPHSPGPTTSYWIDCNDPWVTGTNPGSVTNGTAAMVSGTPTTASVKNVTFGTIPHSGYFWVRVGLPYTSDKKFTSVSVVLR